jgi:hypothetical protein
LDRDINEIIYIDLADSILAVGNGKISKLQARPSSYNSRIRKRQENSSIPPTAISEKPFLRQPARFGSLRKHHPGIERVDLGLLIN